MVSPLTDAPAQRIALGFVEDPWFLVREADGLEYALVEGLGPHTPDERRAMVGLARLLAGEGRTAFFLREADRPRFPGWRTDLFLREATPWFVHG